MNAETVLWTVTGCLMFLGLCALVLRRQLLAMILGLELMINAANLIFVYYARVWSDPAGWAAALLVIAAAAAEVVVGLSLILALNRAGVEADTGSLRELQG